MKIQIGSTGRPEERASAGCPGEDSSIIRTMNADPETNPPPASPEPHPIRKRPWHRHFETVGSISAIIVGVAALFVSWDQSRLMREEVRASVWPALQVDGFASTDHEVFTVGVRIQNAGVGPALIERISVLHDGTLVEDFETLERLMPKTMDRSRQTVAGRIIAAGAIVEPFSFRWADESASDAVDMMEDLTRQWSIEVCYCSTLGDCWTTNADREAPSEVNSCDAVPASDL